MERSAFEAFMIGVYVFIFIIALTAGVLLMSNVIDMVNFANDQAIVGMNGTLAESVGVVTERIYTGEQILAHYRKNIENSQSAYDFKIKLSELGHEESIEHFIQSPNMTKYIGKQFILEYKGKNEDKYMYIFSLKQDNDGI